MLLNSFFFLANKFEHKIIETIKKNIMNEKAFKQFLLNRALNLYFRFFEELISSVTNLKKKKKEIFINNKLKNITNLRII